MRKERKQSGLAALHPAPLYVKQKFNLIEGAKMVKTSKCFH
jgi:hypothetical protein